MWLSCLWPRFMSKLNSIPLKDLVPSIKYKIDSIWSIENSFNLFNLKYLSQMFSFSATAHNRVNPRLCLHSSTLLICWIYRCAVLPHVHGTSRPLALSSLWCTSRPNKVVFPNIWNSAARLLWCPNKVIFPSAPLIDEKSLLYLGRWALNGLLDV